jgi:hypothetical protein
MDIDFHYFATYAAATLAGYTKKETEVIAYAAQFVDEFDYKYGYGTEPWTFNVTELEEPVFGTMRYVDQSGGGCKVSPRRTVQGTGDVVQDYNIRTDMWMPCHFLPGNFVPSGKTADPRHRLREGSGHKKFNLLCRPFSPLAIDMINDLLQRTNCSYFQQLLGLRMHVFADTWAHQDFVGDGIAAINDCAGYYNFYEVKPDVVEQLDWKITQTSMGYAPNMMQLGGHFAKVYLGHGRLGHFPDYGWCRYYYTPKWLQTGKTQMLMRNNPREYETAFYEIVKVLYAAKNNIKQYPYPEDQFKPNYKKDIKSEKEVTQLVREAITLNPSKKLYDAKRNVVDYSISLWLDIIKKYGDGTLPVFEKEAWIKEARKAGDLERVGKIKKDYHWRDANEFQKTNLFKFNLASEHHYAHIQNKLREYLKFELRPWDKTHGLFANVKWQPDSQASVCNQCHTPFNLITRRHHCRACGKIFCNTCAPVKTFESVKYDGVSLPHAESFRICKTCMDKAKIVKL